MRRVQARSWLEDSQRGGAQRGGRRAGKSTPPPLPSLFCSAFVASLFLLLLLLSFLSILLLRGRGGVTERDRVRRVQARSWLEDSQRVGVLGGRRAGKPTPPPPLSSIFSSHFFSSSYSPSSYPFFFFFLLSLLRCFREGGSRELDWPVVSHVACNISHVCINTCDSHMTDLCMCTHIFTQHAESLANQTRDALSCAGDHERMHMYVRTSVCC